MMSGKLTSHFKHEKPTSTAETSKRPVTRTGSKRKAEQEEVSREASLRSEGVAAFTDCEWHVNL